MPAVEPARHFPFIRERWRTLGPARLGDDPPPAASTTKMPCAVPTIAVFI